MTRLLQAIENAAATIRRYTDRRLGEQNTKASLIEPILEALGWDIRDPEEVHREFRPKGRDKPVDYALKMMRTPRLFLEAKGLGETLADRRWITQVLSYATVAGVEWCVLSDGDEYRFYNASAPVDAEEKMFYRVRLTESTPADAERVLQLISRGNLEQNLLESLWESHFIDRRVKAALREMLTTPNKLIVEHVRKRVPKLTAKVIAESIRRLDVRVESPDALPALSNKIQAKPRGSSKTKTATPKASTPQSSVSNSVSLSDIIAAGLITPPLRLFCTHKKQDFEATVLPSGEVRFNGTAYPTPSAAGSAAGQSLSGRAGAINGWTFWRYADAAGKTHILGTLRDEYAKRIGNGLPKAETPPRLKIAGRSA